MFWCLSMSLKGPGLKFRPKHCVIFPHKLAADVNRPPRLIYQLVNFFTTPVLILTMKMLAVLTRPMSCVFVMLCITMPNFPFEISKVYSIHEYQVSIPLHIVIIFFSVGSRWSDQA